jgi:DNA-binding NarL/FixJ family response regulator
VWTEMGTSILAFGPGHAEHHERCARMVGRARRAPRRRTIAEAIAVALDEAAEPVAVDRGGLTAREWEVAQLVAAGMTNRAIASRLVVSHRTVDGHLEHILAKLGFQSRAQVAAWMAERQVAAPG